MNNTITIYSKPNYGGKQQSLDIGSFDVNALRNGIGDDSLRSLQVPQGFKVTLYADNFSGAQQIFIDDEPDVDASASNLTTSIVVESLTPKDYAAYRRVLKITRDANAKILVDNNLASAFVITQKSRDDFNNYYMSLPAVDASTDAGAIYDKALDVRNKGIHLLAAAHSVAASPYAQSVAATPDAVAKHFQSLKGYDQMFGSLNYCECEECESIFGAAAYFVDLMKIVDNAVATSNKNTIPAGLSLQERRPDLWNIPLTCESTNNTVPYLQIVNEVLSETIVLKSNPQNTEADKEEAALKMIATGSYPMNLPYNFYLDYIRTALLQIRISLADIIRAYDNSNNTRYKENLAAEILQLSNESYVLLTTPAEDNAGVAARYGLEPGNIGLLQNIPTFLYQTGLTYEELVSLLNLGRSQLLAPIKAVQIKAAEKDIPEEHFNSISNDLLDRLNRFTRLARQLQWSFADLDWILFSLGCADITSEALIALADVKQLAQQLSLPLTFLSALWSDVKTTGDGTQGKTPFETLFGVSPSQLSGSQPWLVSLSGSGNTTEQIEAFKASNNEVKKLFPGIGVPYHDLAEIAKYVLADESGKVELTVASLSALYRHAILIKSLGLPATQYLILLELAGYDTKPLPVFTPAKVLQLLSLGAWIQTSGFAIRELHFIIRGKETTRLHPAFTEDNLSVIAAAITPLWDEVFSQTDASNKTDAEKTNYIQSILSDDKTVVKQNISSEKGIEDRQALLLTHKKIKKIKELIASALHVPEPLVAAIFSELGLGQSSLLLKEKDNGEATLPFLALLSRWLLLAVRLDLDHTAMGFILENQSVFVSPDGQPLDVYNIQPENIKTFRKLKELSVINAVGIEKLIPLFTTTSDITDDTKQKERQVNLLKELFSWNEEYCYYLLKDKTAIATLEDLYALKKSMAIYTASGIDVYSQDELCALPLLDASSIKNLTTFRNAKDAVLAALKIKIGDAQWSTVYTTVNNTMIERKRSMLIEYAIWLLGKEFTDFNNPRTLSEYLLIDVEMSGCAEISYLKQGLNTVQLYLQRCRLQLEQGITISHDDIPEIWWEWIMNFRIWQANRKVFLYPENYIDPSLRNTKTTLFTKLENYLRQGDINQANVEAAFTSYMNDFEKLARLQYINACNYTVHDTERGAIETLFLFACSHTSPNEFYYITRESGVTWGEWQKIDISINTDYLTPVYVFNKLFLFWVEITNTKDTDPSNSSSKISLWKATIKYTFHNYSGTWIQPQTLLSDFVFKIDASKITIRKDWLNEEQMHWKKVDALPIPADKINGNEEKLFIGYGPFLSLKELSLIDLAQVPDDTAFREFKANLNNAKKYADSNIDIEYADGKPDASDVILCPFYASVLDEDMNESKINSEEEYVFFSPDSSSVSSALTVKKDGLPNNESFPRTNMGSGENIRLTSGGDVPVFNFIGGSELITVKNNPSQFLYNFAGESLLIESDHAANISEASKVYKYFSYPKDEMNAILFKDSLLYASENRDKINLSNEGALLSFLISSNMFTKSTEHMFTCDEEIDKLNFCSIRKSPWGDAITADQDRQLKKTLKEQPSKLTFVYNNQSNNNKQAITAQRLTTNAISLLSRKFFQGGIDEMLSLSSQSEPQSSKKLFDRLGPSANVIKPSPLAADQVSFEGPYGNYYWELFFHAPMLISKMLNTNQQFADSQKWLQYIFNPTQKDGSYWQFMPFRNYTPESIIAQLQNPQEIETYNNHPFDPHAIARLRIGAYEKAVVMEYISNLLDWGDSMFSQYTWESLTSATMLYMYAYDLLGPRPQNLGACLEDKPVLAYKDLTNQSGTSDVPEFLIQLEDSVISSSPNNLQAVPYNNINTYFGIPENDQFIAYWDRIEDRLYKIRHCLNLQGVSQPLPLFQPPVDPMALVRATAANNGLLSQAAITQSTGVPLYRFNVILEKAKAYVQTVIQLGNTLLSALEKNDSEALSQLRSTQQIAVLNMATDIKQQQIDQLNSAKDAMNENKNAAAKRQQHYDSLLAENINAYEIASLTLMSGVVVAQAVALGYRGGAIIGHLTPTIFGLADGGMQLGSALSEGAAISDGIGGILNQSASIVNTAGQYQRRKEDWQLQQQIATDEQVQIQKQIDGIDFQIASAQQDMKIQKENITQANEVDDFLRSKFSNADLYQWMIGRISSLYYESYTMALDMCNKAQEAYNFEMNIANNGSSFITYNYWDSLRKGLLAGEGLLFSLQQMEHSFLTNSTRQLEIEKTISLKQWFPEEFLRFKYGSGPDNANKGSFDFTLRHFHYDFDFPGHYCRKIKYIMLTIPALVGPYQNINAILTQNKSWIATTGERSLISNGDLNESDTKVKTVLIPQYAALSKGSDDTGAFLLDFRDEKYLPFEGTGAVSQWRLDMPPETNRFDFNTISDVIVKIYYTALLGSGINTSDSPKNNETSFGTSYLYVNTASLKQSFPAAWHQMLLSEPDKEQRYIISFAAANYFPDHNSVRNASLKEILVKLITTETSGTSPDIELSLQNSENILPMTSGEGVYKYFYDSSKDIQSLSQNWSIFFKGSKNRFLDDLLDIVVVFIYEATL